MQRWWASQDVVNKLNFVTSSTQSFIVCVSLKNLVWGVILSFWCNYSEASRLQQRVLVNRGQLTTILFIKAIKEGNNWLNTLYILIKLWKSKTKTSLLQFGGGKKDFFRDTALEVAALQNISSLSLKVRLLKWWLQCNNMMGFPSFPEVYPESPALVVVS